MSVKKTIIDSDNGLLPVQRHTIIWTNVGLSSFGPLGRDFSEIAIKIPQFLFKKMSLEMSSAKWWPFCLSLNVLNTRDIVLILLLHKPPGWRFLCISSIMESSQQDISMTAVQCRAIIIYSIFYKKSSHLHDCSTVSCYHNVFNFL